MVDCFYVKFCMLEVWFLWENWGLSSSTAVPLTCVGDGLLAHKGAMWCSSLTKICSRFLPEREEIKRFDVDLETQPHCGETITDMFKTRWELKVLLVTLWVMLKLDTEAHSRQCCDYFRLFAWVVLSLVILFFYSVYIFVCFLLPL